MQRKHLILHLAVVGAALAAVLAAVLTGRLEFFNPVWLLALLALPLFYGVARQGLSGLPPPTNTFVVTVRTLAYLLLVLALAEAQYVLRQDGLCVLYLLDHSASIPNAITDQQLRYVNGTAVTAGRHDQAGIVVFGTDASVEVLPTPKLSIERLYSAVDRNYTDLERAVGLANAAFPESMRKKLVILTDGNENVGDLLRGVRQAAAHQVQVDVLPVSYDFKNEVLVEKVTVPDRLRENEVFDLKVTVNSLTPAPGKLTIYHNGQVVTQQEVALNAGSNVYGVTSKITAPGFHTYTARIESPNDSIKENNEASSYVYIQGTSRVLFVAPSELEVRDLVAACHEESLETDVVGPSGLPESLDQLQNYDCVVLANVPNNFSQAQQEMLRAAVRDLGIGLIMIGGENSFGAGNYLATPIEEALPVTMDIKQKKINPKGALAIILHTCEFDNGNYWAKQIVKDAINNINPQDDVGVIYYGYQGGYRWLFTLRAAADKNGLFNLVDTCEPGDMPSYQQPFAMALSALSNCDAMVRHVIVISDGDPSSPLASDLQAMVDHHITVSTVAISPHSERDIDVLKYVAYKTGGRFYFCKDPKQLPSIFIKEAKVVQRSLIFNEPFHPQMVQATELTKGVQPGELPVLMAYVAATARERALVPIVSENENHDPILAHWQFGLGRSVAFTSDATNNWGKNWVAWDKYKKVWGQIIRWSTRKREKSNLSVRTQMDGRKGKVVIDAVDPDGGFINFLKLDGRVVDPDSQAQDLNLHQTAPGRYEADFEAGKVGVNVLNIGFNDPRTGKSGFVSAGVSVPYSPEYRQLQTNVALLRRAAELGGGKLLNGNYKADDPQRDRVFDSTLPPYKASQPLWDLLLIPLILLFFLDVVLRRVIFTRSEVNAAWAAIRAPFARRAAKAAQRDATMANLLRVKQAATGTGTATGEGAAPPAAPGTPSSAAPGAPRPAIAPTGDFRARLDQAARQSTAAVPPPVATLGIPPPPPGDAPAGAPPAPGKAPTSPKDAPPADAGYTNRLLQAKKRAQKKDDAEG